MVNLIGYVKKKKVNIDEYRKEQGKVTDAFGFQLIAKLGSIYMHHFAYKDARESDWSDNAMTDWHLTWQKILKNNYIEVPIEKDDRKHVADIKLQNRIYEIQHSYISDDEIQERELFYQNPFWIIDCRDEKFKNLIIKGQEYILYLDKRRFVRKMKNVFLDCGKYIYFVHYSYSIRQNRRKTETVVCSCARTLREDFIKSHFPEDFRSNYYMSNEYILKYKEIYE